jgi:protein ImuA
MHLALQNLRHQLENISHSSGQAHSDSASVRPLMAFGIHGIDKALKGGLEPAALHDFYAFQTSDSASLAGFMACLAQNLSQSGRLVVWVRQTMADVETGQLYPHGLLGLGLDPSRLVLVRARKPTYLLSAALDAVRCSSLACVVIEAWGNPHELDLTATRRLGLAAEKSGVTPFLLRAACDVQPSAAMTRWQVRSAPSSATGHPTFDLTLTRNKNGTHGQGWRVEWHHDLGQFRAVAQHNENDQNGSEKRAPDKPLPGSVVRLSARRPGGQAEPAIHRQSNPEFGQTG